MSISLIEVALDRPDSLRPHASRFCSGVRAAVTAAADLWQGTGVARAVPTSATTLSIASDNAADTAAGTGARTVRIDGLDASGAEQTEDVPMNGVTPVTSSKLWLRVNAAYAIAAGSGGVNAGNISLTHTGAAGVIAFIAASEGRALMAAYSVPTGRVALVLALRAQGEDVAATPEVTLYERAGILGTTPTLRAVTKLPVDGRSSAIDFRAYPYVEGPCDLFASAVSGVSARIAAQFDVLLASP